MYDFNLLFNDCFHDSKQLLFMIKQSCFLIFLSGSDNVICMFRYLEDVVK